MTIFCRNYILLVYQRDVCTLQNHLGPTPTICNYHQPSTTSSTHLQSAKATSLNYFQPPLINPNQPQSTLISLHNPNHLQPLSINSSQSFSHENHCKCYKKLTSRSWPMLFTLAYFFFFFLHTLFCIKNKRLLWMLFSSAALTTGTVQLYILQDYSSVRIGFNISNKRHTQGVVYTMLV